MRPIPTTAHGILDYLVGIVLLFAPNLFGFAQLGGAPVTIPRLVGVLILILSLFTNYELGWFKRIPVRRHLVVDYALTLFLVFSPWLFHFNHQPPNVWLPQVMIGLLGFFLALMTQIAPYHVTIRQHRPVI